MSESEEYAVDELGEEEVFAETSAPIRASVSMATLPVTGEPRVDDALARLQDIESLPVSEHVPVYDDVRRRLHETLSGLSGQ